MNMNAHVLSVGTMPISCTHPLNIYRSKFDVFILSQKVYQFGHYTISVSTNVNRNYVLVEFLV